MDKTERIDKNRLFTYILITIGMVGLIILGVAWSRNRANQLAQTNEAPPVAQQEPAPNQEQPVTVSSGSNDPHIASTQTTQDSSVHVVPAAGSTDTVLFVGSLSVAIFMGARLLQARRHVRTAYRTHFTF